MEASIAEQINAEMVGFDRLYGLRVLSCSEEEASGSIDVRDELRQPMGLLHGGVFASIAESLSSMATAIFVHHEGKIAMGLSNSTSFMRPVTSGRVHAQARRIHKGRTTWIWDVHFTDEAGRLCAATRMTVAVRHARPA